MAARVPKHYIILYYLFTLHYYGKLQLALYISTTPSLNHKPCIIVLMTASVITATTLTTLDTGNSTAINIILIGHSQSDSEFLAIHFLVDS